MPPTNDNDLIKNKENEREKALVSLLTKGKMVNTLLSEETIPEEMSVEFVVITAASSVPDLSAVVHKELH